MTNAEREKRALVEKIEGKNINAELLDALLSLRNEVAGITGAFEYGLRPVIGNTNFQCILRKLDDADKAIAKAENARIPVGETPKPNG